jgi:hypothetical protein
LFSNLRLSIRENPSEIRVIRVIRGKNIVSKTRPPVNMRDGVTALSRRWQANPA